MSEHRSYSQLNSLRTCGWKYKLERVDGVPSRPSWPAIAGKVVHAVTETVDHAMHSGEKSRTVLASLATDEYPSVLAEEIASNLSEAYPDPNAWKTYGRPTTAKPHGEGGLWWTEVGLPTSLTAYIDWRLAGGMDVYTIPGFGPAIEVPFEVTIGNVAIKGYIDRIFVTPEGVPLLVDIKSGGKPKTDEQLGLYVRAMRAGLPGVDWRWASFVYGLKHGTAQVTTPRDETRWSDDQLEATYLTGDAQIRQNLFLPNAGEACFHCGVSESCEFAAAVM